MAGRKYTGRNATLNRHRSFKKRTHVGHDGTRTSDPIGQFFVGDFELLEQLLIRRCLLEGVQLHSMDVLRGARRAASSRHLFHE